MSNTIKYLHYWYCCGWSTYVNNIPTISLILLFSSYTLHQDHPSQHFDVNTNESLSVVYLQKSKRIIKFNVQVYLRQVRQLKQIILED